MSVARARHEGVNAMFKQFRILKDMYRHGLEKHSWVFKSIAVLVQMKLIEGRGSYQIIDFTVPPVRNVAVRRRRQYMFDVYFGNVQVPINRNNVPLGQQSNDEDSSNNENEEENNENKNENNENENENNENNENENVSHGEVVVRDGLVVQEESRLITKPENMYPTSPSYSSPSDDEE